jgi:hypothetical protein
MEPKKRNGLVTAWLLLVILSNTYTGIKYLLFTDTVMAQLDLSTLKGIIIAQGLLSLAMGFFALMVFEWKKWGFWGMIGTTITTVALSMVMGMGTILPIIVGVGIIGILYGMLQIKKDGVTTWDNLE